jgi:hypothetical protein
MMAARERLPMNYFTEHPASVGESYFEHLKAASGFGVAMIGTGIACLIHGFVPALFTRTGSQTIERLHDRMITNRRAKNSSSASVDFAR